MSANNTPSRGGKRIPKDVPQMTEEQKKALCKVRGKLTSTLTARSSPDSRDQHADLDLYNDPRSLVQIWRDAGVPYQDDEMPPPSGPRSNHRRTLTGGSVASASSGRSNNSQALVATGSPAQRNRVHDGGYSNNPNGYTSGYPNGYASGYANGASPFTSPVQQHVNPTSRMGHPATAFFIPDDQDTLFNATKAANADAYNTNGAIGVDMDWTGKMNYGMGLDGHFSPPAPGNRGMPPPGVLGNRLENIFRNNSEDHNRSGHKRNNSRFGSNSSWASNGSNNNNNNRP